ncbi:MAG: XdhC family protein [Alphaproteobacteria bacterium]
MTAPEHANKAEMILEQAAAWHRNGLPVALATVVATWGSSPRPAGSQMAIAGDGAFVGSVSGGCIEGAVITEAKAVMTDGKPRLLDYGITNERAWEVGLACGGRVEFSSNGSTDEARPSRSASRGARGERASGADHPPE